LRLLQVRAHVRERGDALFCSGARRRFEVERDQLARRRHLLDQAHGFVTIGNKASFDGHFGRAFGRGI
jgi:hypothetical protein